MPVSITHASLAQPQYLNIDSVASEDTVEFWFTSRPTEFTPNTLPTEFYLKWDLAQSRPVLKRYAKYRDKAPEPTLNVRKETIWNNLLKLEEEEKTPEGIKKNEEIDKLFDKAFEDSENSIKKSHLKSFQDNETIAPDSINTKTHGGIKFLSWIFAYLWIVFGLSTLAFLLSLNLPLALFSGFLTFVAYGIGKKIDPNFD